MLEDVLISVMSKKLETSVNSINHTRRSSAQNYEKTRERGVNPDGGKQYQLEQENTVLTMECMVLLLTYWDKTCRCRVWPQSGLRCAYAIATMREHRVKVKNYVDEYYSIDKYKKAYARMINSISDRNLQQ